MDYDTVEVLMVEDNPNDAELALRSLKKNKLVKNILVVKDGVEALDFLFCRGKFEERCKDNKPKVILLDLKLPKINGLEVLKKIKSEEQTRTIPVVVLTSSAEERDIVESYSLGVNSYIVKPVDFGKFVKAMSCLGIYWLARNKSC